MQNVNGGFASYELIRGPGWLEWLNPAEVFGAPPVWHSVLTESLIAGCFPKGISWLNTLILNVPLQSSQLLLSSESIILIIVPTQSSKSWSFPTSLLLNAWFIGERFDMPWITYTRPRSPKVDGSVRGVSVLLMLLSSLSRVSLLWVRRTKHQGTPVRPVTFWLVDREKMEVGERVTRSVAIVMYWAIRWKRREQSCEVVAWVEHEQTQVVQTCWAAMALIYAHYPYPEPIERAVKLVMSRQLPVSSNCVHSCNWLM